MSKYSEKVKILGLKREEGYLYYVKGRDLYKVKRSGGFNFYVRREPPVYICSIDEREKGYNYFLDKEGDISRVPLKQFM